MADAIRKVHQSATTPPGRASALTASVHPRVLLLQPAGDNRDMYALYLRHSGVTTLAPASAHEAMAIAASVDVIVTGIGVAGRADGLEFVRDLRRAARRHIPVIVVSAHVLPSDRDRAFAAGCDRFLPKPCLPDALLAEIGSLLRDTRDHE